jgi:hypothetical protein
MNGMLEERESVSLVDEKKKAVDIDDAFFFHQPSSAFSVDPRIPTDIRDPLSEADTCHRSNSLTGASGALRKVIFKLLKIEGVPDKDQDGADLDYSQRIDLLKAKTEWVSPEDIDSLKMIKGISSQELHENDWEDLDGSSTYFLLETLREILYQIYILPDERVKKRSELSRLHSLALSTKKKESPSKEPDTTQPVAEK